MRPGGSKDRLYKKNGFRNRGSLDPTGFRSGGSLDPPSPEENVPHVRHLPSLTLEAAKAISAAAEAYAEQKGWTVAIAVVDAAGGLLLFHRLDDTQPASQEIAVEKARTAARFKRPTKALEDVIAGGRTAFLSVDGVTALEGGIPIEAAGKIIGAIGVSGMASSQDAEVARAGLEAFEGDQG